MSDDWLKIHVERIEKRMDRFEAKVDQQFQILGEKVDRQTVKEAHQAGKINGAQLVISLVVSIVVSAIALYAK